MTLSILGQIVNQIYSTNLLINEYSRHLVGKSLKGVKKDQIMDLLQLSFKFNCFFGV